MAKEFPLAVVIKAVDKVTAPLARINARINKITAPTRRLGAAFSALGKESGITKLGGAIGGVSTQVMRLTRRMAVFGGVAATAIGLVVKRAIDAGDALNDLRNQTGVSAQKLAELEYAFGQSGVGADEFEGAIRKMTVGLGQAKHGTGALHGYLKKTNPALLAQLNAAKDSGTKLNILINALDKTTDAEQRAALGAAAFGRGVGIKMAGAMKDGKESLKDMMAVFAENNPDMDKFATASDAVNDSFGFMSMILKGVRNKVLLPLLPIIEKLTLALGARLARNADSIEAWAKDFAKELPGKIENLIKWFERWGERLAWVERNFGLLNTAIFLVAAAVFGPLVLSFTRLALVLTPIIVKFGILIGMAMAKFFVDCAVAMQLAGGAMQFFNIMLWANPIGLVIAGIVALIAIGYILWKKWDAITGGIRKAFGWMGDVASGIASLIGDAFGAAADYILGVFSPVTDLLTWVAKKLGIISSDAATTADGVDKRFNGGRGGVMSGAPVTNAPPRAFTPIPAKGEQSAKVVVDFQNAPKGTRVTTDPRSSANVNTSMGYNMVLGGAV